MMFQVGSIPDLLHALQAAGSTASEVEVGSSIPRVEVGRRSVGVEADNTELLAEAGSRGQAAARPVSLLPGAGTGVAQVEADK